MKFLEYLKSWKTRIQNRPGNFTKNARARMFLYWQKYEGFEITVHSAIECTRFLLQEGMEFVLTERFCQDLVEYFGNQRKLGRRSDNPDIHQFGYNMPIPSESRGQCHARVVTQGGGRINDDNGNKLQMPNYHAEKEKKTE
jgi:hypothetical protein